MTVSFFRLPEILLYQHLSVLLVGWKPTRHGTVTPLGGFPTHRQAARLVIGQNDFRLPENLATVVFFTHYLFLT
ncbi:MAG: hypothetical protein IIU35_03225 [Neisseriaceae bacterium]|nr:hypothetical protein [Neisseriaceae bacterium]